MQPQLVETVSPRPFDEVMGRQTARAGGTGEAVKPEWRKSFQTEATWTPSTSPVASMPPTIGMPRTYAPVVTEPTAVRWGRAIGYGLLVALVGGAIWGLIGGYTGYITVLVAIGIGVGEAMAVRKGAGSPSWGLIVLAIFLTLLAVFLGDIIALSIVLSGYGGTVIDALILYPDYIAFAPGEACLSYIFGLLGAAYGAYALYKEMRSGRARGAQTGYPQNAGGPQSATWSGGIDRGVASPSVRQSAGPSVLVLARTLTEAQIQVDFPSPVSKTLVARYETKFGKASVSINGIEVTKTRVWTGQKTVEVPLPAHPAGVVKVRFFGIPSPHIEVSAAGSIVAAC